LSPSFTNTKDILSISQEIPDLSPDEKDFKSQSMHSRIRGLSNAEVTVEELEIGNKVSGRVADKKPNYITIYINRHM
jgi:hypothetical protein